MTRLKVVGALAAVAFLSGCGTTDIEALRTAEATGSPFSQALTEEYKQITAFEADEMFDWIDAGYFAQKGLRTAAGEEPEPELVQDWWVSGEPAAELESARGRLMAVLDAGARESNPSVAAHAQGRFDCWIEQQEEGWQTEDIAACRDAFYAALEELEGGGMMMKGEEVTVFFAFDSAALDAAAEAGVDEAVAIASKMGLSEFSVTGHTDTVGTEEYNLGLSLRRAESVKAALVARGVPAENVSTAGRGFSELAVPTGPNVYEPANRRVVIVAQ